MRRKENVEVCIERLQRQLHEQKWQVNRHGCHQNEAQG